MKTLNNHISYIKTLTLLSIAALSGCSIHPSYIEAKKFEQNVPCDSINEQVQIAKDEYETAYSKQELSHGGDIVLVSLIGLPMMPDNSEEVSKALGKYQYMLGKQKYCESN
ncbi:hypothetical protein [Vibrio phage phiKT1024]|nr:hypothetical protein [Vibrio phage phiKT1024]